MKTSIRCCWIVACCLSVAGVCSAQSAGTSLGDTARQNKAHKKAKIVIGDDDVAHSTDPGPLSASPDTSSTDVSDAQGDSSDLGKKSGDGRSASQNAELKKKIEKAKSDEQGYRDALKTAHERLDKAENDFQREVAREAIANNEKNVQVTSDRRKQLEAQQKDAQGAPKD
jgi:hypothetical protein